MFRICLEKLEIASSFIGSYNPVSDSLNTEKWVVKSSVNVRKKNTWTFLVSLFVGTTLLLCGCSSTNGEASSLSSRSESSSSTASSSETPASSSSSASSEASSAADTPSSAVSSSSAASSEAPQNPVDSSYFDDAVFVGDSVTLKLKYYVMNQRKSDSDYLGKAEFLCSGSLGSANALWEVSDESVHPLYDGKKMLIEDAVAQLKAKKVYIMLGVNDIGLYGVEQSIQNFDTLCQNILKQSPEAQIFAQSVTPMVKGKELKDLNNKNIETYDKKLKELCAEQGYHFIDVASVMRDKDGYLPLEYCSDPSGANSLGIHFTDAACQKWVDYLMNHADA